MAFASTEFASHVHSSIHAPRISPMASLAFCHHQVQVLHIPCLHVALHAPQALHSNLALILCTQALHSRLALTPCTQSLQSSLAKLDWQSPSGNPPLVKSNWPPPIGKAPTGNAPNWQCLTSKAQLATPSWQCLTGNACLFGEMLPAKTATQEVLPLQIPSLRVSSVP